jgi:hypothetical protein
VHHLSNGELRDHGRGPQHGVVAVLVLVLLKVHKGGHEGDRRGGQLLAAGQTAVGLQNVAVAVTNPHSLGLWHSVHRRVGVSGHFLYPSNAHDIGRKFVRVKWADNRNMGANECCMARETEEEKKLRAKMVARYLKSAKEHEKEEEENRAGMIIVDRFSMEVERESGIRRQTEKVEVEKDLM